MAAAAIPAFGLRFEAPDPDPIPDNKGGAPDSRPNPGPDRSAAPAKDERFEALERELDEMRQSNRQLLDIVGRNAPAPKPADRAAAEPTDDIDWGEDEADPAADEPEDAATLVEDLSKLGKDALSKRGFVRVADVKKIVREESRKAAVTAARQIVGKARAEVTNESAIMAEFPDLADPQSELFKATIPLVTKAARMNPNAAKDPNTLYLAATAAKAMLDAKKPAAPGRPAADEVDDDPEEEDREPVRRAPVRTNERNIRIASQQGDRGRGRSRVEAPEDDDVAMDSDAKAVARQMGLTDDEWKDSARQIRKQVTSSGGRGRR